MCEQPEVYRHEQPKARISHVCCECGGEIRGGEVYHKHSGIWSGDADTFKVCADCEAIRAEVDEGIKDPEDRSAFGCLYESVFESRDRELITRYVGNRRKRGAKVPDWMAKRELEPYEP